MSDCAELKCTNAFIEKELTKVASAVCKKAVGNNYSFVETRCALQLTSAITEKVRVVGSREAFG
jgi:hypothetical protein